jgi:hypothetical protein
VDGRINAWVRGSLVRVDLHNLTELGVCMQASRAKATQQELTAKIQQLQEGLHEKEGKNVVSNGGKASLRPMST